MKQDRSNPTPVEYSATMPEARAKRLRRLRNLANLSRQQMCDDDININTYIGWEVARFGGLSKTGAKKVIDRVAQEQVICTLDWLLHGQGMPPYLIYDRPARGESEENLIKNELALFETQYEHSVWAQIEDDGLSPIFEQGDYVAGVKLTDSQQITNHLVEQFCIIEVKTDQFVVRKLKKGSKPGSYNLVCTNVDTQVDEPIMQNTSIRSAAQVIRHYKLNNSSTSKE